MEAVVLEGVVKAKILPFTMNVIRYMVEMTERAVQ